ncbi:hypothetical protein [Phormidesmis priestleyi]|uniref:hypothetical protein n=1 Tax=Phormidesmis priestleyi TaxID=268141 RepID=UPI00083AB386|nr:hypothetical protein [Phormidesmis priestleyi]
MNDESMLAQGTVPNQAAAEALQAITGQTHYAGGNALLSAEAEAGAETDHSPIDQSIATNTPSHPAKDHLTVEQLGDKENLSLINDVAIAE